MRIVDSQINIQRMVRVVSLFLLIGLYIGILMPVLNSGLYTDDILNTLTSEYVRSEFDGSLFKMIAYYSNQWIANGRLFPVALGVTYSTWFYLGMDPVYTKVFNITLFFVAALLTARLLFVLSKNETVSLLFLLFLPICIQTRVSLDPILSFPPLLAFSIILIVSQALLFEIYCRKHHILVLILSYLIFLTSLLTYEVCVIAIFVNFIILFNNRRFNRRELFSVLVYLILLFSYFIILLFLKSTALNTYTGSEFNFS